MTKSKKIDYTSLSKCNELFVSEDDFNNPLCKKFINECIKEGFLKPEYTLDELLHVVWGCNLDLGYELFDGEHRTRFGKTYTGKRYTFFERYDNEWAENGMISDKMKKARESIVAKQNYERW